ncbi:40S ribosomal protein S15-like [Limulus polyphemus]|uniref:40S ribosomal protein S15 n=1 Tax=Limulus polyphemus TaxID=6850 RepID=A0ABM1TRI9_LIMPO|nr:40S ribosomal protein S15-like [Limulus polyphemus]
MGWDLDLYIVTCCPVTGVFSPGFYVNVYFCFREQLMELLHSRARRRFSRGLKRKPMALIKKLRKAKKEADPLEKPEVVKTHLRDMIIVPEMVGSIVGVYNGKTFNQVEIKPEMIGHYLGEFSITYKPVKHGRPGIGATHSSRFIPLK